VVGLRHPRLQGPQQVFARRHLARNVPDPRLRAALTPDYVLGCKRILLSSTYLPALSRDNVDVVTDGIARVEADAILTRNGGRDVGPPAALLAVQPRLPEPPIPLDGREPLVPRHHRDLHVEFELLHEVERSLGGGTEGSVHVDRKAHDDQPRLLLPGDPGDVDGGDLFDRGERERHPLSGIAHREPRASTPEIDRQHLHGPSAPGPAARSPRTSPATEVTSPPVP